MEFKKQEIENLIVEIIEILQSEADNAPQDNKIESETTSKKSNFLSVNMIQEAKTISTEEKKVLEKVALIREEGLIHLRKNEMEEGKSKLKQSTEISQEIDLSIEGTLVYRTFQCAAESYLSLKHLDYKKAEALMETALETHKELNVNFGHPIVVRRIHLARNIAKVWSLSEKVEESFQLSVQLIKYTLFDNQEWPLEICRIENADKMPFEMKMFLCNQMINQLISILSHNRIEEIQFQFEEFIEELKPNPNKDAKLISSWCSAYQAILEGEQLTYLKNAKYFFENHNGLLPSANHYMLTSLNENFLS